MPEYNDLPREEAMERAQKILDEAGEKASKHIKIYFKFTCAHCGERCTFDDPYVLYESGECTACQKITYVEKAGFALMFGV